MNIKLQKISKKILELVEIIIIITTTKIHQDTLAF